MPSKYSEQHRKRFPDYGVPNSMIKYGTRTERILYYAKFRKSYFYFEEYRKFYAKEVRPVEYRNSVERLRSYGWLSVREDGAACITADGVKALRNIAARNAMNPKRKRD